MAGKSFARLARFAMVMTALSCVSAAPAFARLSVIDDIVPDYTPADTLDGNYLAAIIAGASRDTSAAAIFFHEALKDDPRNVDLRERAFVAFLANGSMPEAIATARDIARGDRNNGLAQLVLGVDALQRKQYTSARRSLTAVAGGAQLISLRRCLMHGAGLVRKIFRKRLALLII